jgi:hypothetical protein
MLDTCRCSTTSCGGSVEVLHLKPVARPTVEYVQAWCTPASTRCEATGECSPYLAEPESHGLDIAPTDCGTTVEGAQLVEGVVPAGAGPAST